MSNNKKAIIQEAIECGFEIEHCFWSFHVITDRKGGGFWSVKMKTGEEITAKNFAQAIRRIQELEGAS